MSEQIEISQADLLREWITKGFDEKRDLSNSSRKKNDRIAFCKAYSELNTNEKKLSKHYNEILKELAEQKGKSHSEIGVKKPKVNSSMLNSSSDMNAILEPRPQAEIIQPNGMNPNQPQIPGQPGVPNQPYVNPNMTVDSIGAMAQGATFAIKALIPELESLTDEEQKLIGTVLMPPLSGIQDERIQKYMFSIITVIGVFAPKLVKARALRKQNKLKNKKESVEKKGDESVQDFETRIRKNPIKAESKTNVVNHNEEEDDSGEGTVGW